MPVTIKDVAKIAKVSPSTVSRVIADNPKISEPTKKRVFAAMQELNYQPNLIARSLANNKTYTLGLVIPAKDRAFFNNPFFIDAMRGLSLYAQEKGYFILYNYCVKQEDELQTIKRFIQSKWVDGVILMAPRLKDTSIRYLKKAAHPFVVIGRPEEDRETCFWVDNDNEKAMFDVVTTLIKKGKKRIAYIGGEQQYTVYRHRLRGYKKALTDQGIQVDQDLIIENDPTQDMAYLASKDLLNTTRPDAIVATDDFIAFGVRQALDDYGIHSTALVGFNNTTLASYQKPTLSSVNIQADILGEKAAKLLIDVIEKPDQPVQHIIVPTEFIERESSQ